MIPVILSGGTGSRLWPLSRELHPKPFIKLPDGFSLLQKTFLRAATLPDVQEILTVTNQDLFFHTQHEYQALTAPIKSSYLLEPQGRNTAPAIVTAALHLKQTHPGDTILAVMPVDHLIENQAAFIEAAEQAAALAKLGRLVVLGLQPNKPETGFGYIEIDPTAILLPQANVASARSYGVKRFTEKPDFAAASDYIASGRHFWNAGMFFFTIDTILNETKEHAPELLQAVKHCLEISSKQYIPAKQYLKLEKESFIAAPDISIDYCLMEKSKRVATVTCDLGWNDIGSWNAMSELVAPDAKGNRVSGQTILHDAKDCYIHGSDRLIGAIGVENLIIVDTDDALLVADKSRAQDVKHLVKELNLVGSEITKVHKTVHRPWGYYAVIGVGENFKIKIINVKPGASLSLQLHRFRSEHWVVVRGVALTTNGEEQSIVKANESIYIPAGHKHRLENRETTDLMIVEVQCGEYLGEDDIVRFEDIYERIS